MDERINEDFDSKKQRLDGRKLDGSTVPGADILENYCNDGIRWSRFVALYEAYCATCMLDMEEEALEDFKVDTEAKALDDAKKTKALDDAKKTTTGCVSTFVAFLDSFCLFSCRGLPAPLGFIYYAVHRAGGGLRSGGDLHSLFATYELP